MREDCLEGLLQGKSIMLDRQQSDTKLQSCARQDTSNPSARATLSNGAFTTDNVGYKLWNPVPKPLRKSRTSI